MGSLELIPKVGLELCTVKKYILIYSFIGTSFCFQRRTLSSIQQQWASGCNKKNFVRSCDDNVFLCGIMGNRFFLCREKDQKRKDVRNNYYC